MKKIIDYKKKNINASGDHKCRICGYEPANYWDATAHGWFSHGGFNIFGYNSEDYD